MIFLTSRGEVLKPAGDFRAGVVDAYSGVQRLGPWNLALYSSFKRSKKPL